MVKQVLQSSQKRSPPPCALPCAPVQEVQAMKTINSSSLHRLVFFFLFRTPWPWPCLIRTRLPGDRGDQLPLQSPIVRKAKSGVVLANQSKRRLVHELFQNSMWIALVFPLEFTKRWNSWTFRFGPFLIWFVGATPERRKMAHKLLTLKLVETAVDPRTIPGDRFFLGSEENTWTVLSAFFPLSGQGMSSRGRGGAGAHGGEGLVFFRLWVGGQTTNKYKPFFGTVPGKGGGQICLCFAFFLGEKKHINRISRKSQEKSGTVLGKSRENIVCQLFWVFFFSEVDQPSHRKIGQVYELCSEARV